MKKIDKKIKLDIKGSATKGWIVTMYNPACKFKWDQALLDEELKVMIDAFSEIQRKRESKKKK
jgi:hypothetical protein